MTPFLISQCIPVMNRLPSLKLTLPYTIASANLSPPIEIVILDYGSTDGLEDFIRNLPLTSVAPAPGNFITYLRYDKNPYFHISHARNLANLISQGDYLSQAGAEMLVTESFFPNIRCVIEDNHHPNFLVRAYGSRGHYYPHWCPQIAIVERKEFIAAGGFDERIEYYWFEDRDLAARLVRRGNKPVFVPLDFREQETPLTDTQTKKYKNYRPSPRRSINTERIHRRMRDIYRQNGIDNILIANEGKEWGDFNRIF